MSRKKRSKKRQAQSPAAEQKNVLRWRVHPFAESFYKSAVAVGALFAMGALGYGIFWDFDGWGVPAAAGSMAIFLLALSKFFLPTFYAFSPDGIEIKSLFSAKKYDWGRFRAFRHDESRVMLSPFEDPSRMRSRWAVTLLLDKKRGKEIIDFVRTKVAVDESHRADTAGKDSQGET
jgi:hypothetical protein